MRIDRLTPNPAVFEELGARLARVRKQRGLTQDELAKKAGLGVATLRRIEDGQDSKLGSWVRLLRALDMAASIDALLPADFRSPMADARGPRRARRAPKERPFTWGDEQS